MQQQDKLYTLDDIPIVDIAPFLQDADAALESCKQVADSFHTFGICIIKDPRANMADNDRFIDIMECYFDDVTKDYYDGKDLADVRPDHHYLVGLTPTKIERARRHAKKIEELTDENKPMSPLVPVQDQKWRYYWKIGERPPGSVDNFPQVPPADGDYPDWADRMNNWGYKLHGAAFAVAEMAAKGMGLEQDRFSKCLVGGPHLLAPNGSDLRINKTGSILNGFHYDISFMTCHGKSRYPGLYIWLRNNQKVLVKVPDGCLILQAGITFEHMTGGYVHAGFHEVVVSDKTEEAYEKGKDLGKSPWRVSSTLFAMFRHDVHCAPEPKIAHLHVKDAVSRYPARTAHDILLTELNATSMISPKEQFEATIQYNQYEDSHPEKIPAQA